MKKFAAIPVLLVMFSISAYSQQNGNPGINSSNRRVKTKPTQITSTHTNSNSQHSPNAVTSHDKYANQEVSYAIGNKVKTKIPVAKRKKPKLMEEEGIFYRKRH